MENQNLDADARRKMSATILLRFIETCSDWEISTEDELKLAGGPDITIYESWADAALEETDLHLDENILLRMGAIIAILERQTLRIPSSATRKDWLFGIQRGPFYRGKSPFEILSDADIAKPIALREKLDWLSNLPWSSNAPVTRLGRSHLFGADPGGEKRPS